MRRPSKKSEVHQKIAKERIGILLKLAEKEFKKHPERSHRYVELARKIGMKYNVRIPKELNRRICKKCNRYLVPGANCMVRASAKHKAMEIKCLECGNVKRYPYK